MNNELKMALETLEKEKDISREIMLEAIENSLITACKGHFGRDTDNSVWRLTATPMIFMYMWRKRWLSRWRMM